MAADCRASWAIIPTVPFHGQIQWMPQRIFIIIVWAFQTDGITSSQRFFLSTIPLSLFPSLLPSFLPSFLCPQRAWVIQRCIGLPVFQQPAFYEWVLKISESWPCSDVSIFISEGWRRGTEQRGVMRDVVHIVSEKASLCPGAPFVVTHADHAPWTAVCTSSRNLQSHDIVMPLEFSLNKISSYIKENPSMPVDDIM